MSPVKSLNNIWLKNPSTYQSAWHIVGAQKSLLKCTKLILLSIYLSHIASLEKKSRERALFFTHI